MKFRSHSFLFVLLIVTALAFAYGYGLMTNSLNASGHDRNKKSVGLISESIRITAKDGAKPIGQLIREQSSIEIPDQAISSFHFLVDPFSDALILPGVEGFQPSGFQYAILPGQDKQFKIPEIPIRAPEALNFFLVKSAQATNFIVVIEFYPR
jgi:hypothetical protein